MASAESVRRADLALADLTADGGLLQPEQQDTFIRNLIDQPTVLREIRTQPMNSPSMKINKIGFGSRILRAAPQSGGSGTGDTGADPVEPRHLALTDRAKADLGQITLNTKEVIAEVHIPDEVLEDNIERGDLQNTILALIAERAALDLEELVIQGDTGSLDTYLALLDGVLKLSTSNVVDAAGNPVSVDIFNDEKKALPTRFRRNLAALRYYNSMDVESDYRVQLSNRGTGLGDAVLTGAAPVPILGVPLRGVALMPNASGLLTNPQNIIWGVQRNVRIERDRDIRARSWIIVLTARVALAIEEVDAVVKLINLG